MSAEGISSQVRRIAILVTSLDASAGRQLLMAMPTELARQVRRAMTQLGHVDPDEQRQILAEFRMQAIASGDDAQTGTANAATAANSVARSHSSNTTVHTSQPNTNLETAASIAPSSSGPSSGFMGSSASSASSRVATYETTNSAHNKAEYAPVGSGLSHVSVSALSELLRGERATVVAVVLSQLEPKRGAELLSKLPKALQREAIVNFSRIGQIDPDAMAAIDEQLAHRIADYHHRQAGDNQSTFRMQELLAAATPDLRSDWQSTLAQAEPLLANRLGITPTTTSPDKSSVSQPKASQPTTNRTAKQRPAAAPGASMLDLLADNVVTTADQRINKPLSSPPSHSMHDEELITDQPHILPFPGNTRSSSTSNSTSNLTTNTTNAAAVKATHASNVVAFQKTATIPFEQILDLPAEDIGRILAAAETEVILYALAGATPAFMKRFMAMLDRSDRRALEARLKQLRAINLQDVDAAQRRLCELASNRQESKAAA